jgi:hypothetical protein
MTVLEARQQLKITDTTSRQRGRSTSRNRYLSKNYFKKEKNWTIADWDGVSHVLLSTCNIEILERFQQKSLRMTVDAPWYVPNTVIRRNLQIPTPKEEILHRYSSRYVLASVHTQWPDSNAHGATRQQATAKWSAYQIPTVTVVFVVLVCKSRSQKPQLHTHQLQSSASEHSSTAIVHVADSVCRMY